MKQRYSCVGCQIHGIPGISAHVTQKNVILQVFPTLFETIILQTLQLPLFIFRCPKRGFMKWSFGLFLPLHHDSLLQVYSSIDTWDWHLHCFAMHNCPRNMLASGTIRHQYNWSSQRHTILMDQTIWNQLSAETGWHCMKEEYLITYRAAKCC